MNESLTKSITKNLSILSIQKKMINNRYDVSSNMKFNKFLKNINSVKNCKVKAKFGKNESRLNSDLSDCSLYSKYFWFQSK